MNIKEKFRHCGDTWKVNNVPVYRGRRNQESNLKFFLKHGNGEKTDQICRTRWKQEIYNNHWSYPKIKRTQVNNRLMASQVYTKNKNKSNPELIKLNNWNQSRN